MGSDGSPRKFVNESVYVAVGRDVDESKSTLLWALRNFGGQFRILHVHQPDTYANESSFDEVKAWSKYESQKVDKILDTYIHICRQAKVDAKKRCIETKDIGKGIVELVELHNITKLVMGAAADRHYTNGMTELKSSKAVYVNHDAQPSCQIWFVANGHLIQRREAAVDMETAPSSSPAPCSSATESYPSISRHISRLHLGENSGLSLFPYERSVDDARNESCSSAPVEQDLKNSNEIYDEFARAMKEAENTRRDAFHGLMKRLTASQESAIDAIRKAKAFENLYMEESRRMKEVGEEKQGLEARNKQLEEDLLIARAQQQSLENQIASSEHTVKELKKEIDENVRRNQTSSSSHEKQYLSEFSFLEIQRATDNFEPSMKIGEYRYGSIYKAFLHHAEVATKLLQSGAERGLLQFQREMEIMSKLRHPNIVTLIGVCSDRYVLIYEHLQNGSLEDQLAIRDDTPPLSWKTRIRIAAQVCSALSFLHSSKPHGYVHGNLNPRNILLDANFVPKLSDFGSFNSTRMTYREAADVPHLDPHLLATGELSPKCDTYSFGIVLLQILTGRSSALNLIRDVRDAVDGGNASYMTALLDPLADWPLELAMRLAQLALECCEMDQSQRPDLGSDDGRVLLEQMRASMPCQQPQENNNQPPDYFLCPILQEVMEEPHVAADGFTYEAEVLREWFRSGHDTSPMTNLSLPHFDLIPNLTLRSGIQQWLENH